MKAIVIDQPLELRAAPKASAPVIRTLPIGELIDLGAPDTTSWTPVLLPRRRQAFIQPDAKIRVFRRITADKAAIARASPKTDAPESFRLRGGIHYFVGESVDGEGGAWLRVRDAFGADGYLPPGSATRRAVPPAVERARRTIMMGALVSGVGVVATLGSVFVFASGRGGGSGVIVLAWGPLLFGGIWFATGVSAYLTHRNDPS